jgi:hypothetical protein
MAETLGNSHATGRCRHASAQRGLLAGNAGVKWARSGVEWRSSGTAENSPGRRGNGAGLNACSGRDLPPLRLAECEWSFARDSQFASLRFAGGAA